MSITHKSLTNSIWECLMMSLAIMPFLNDVSKMCYIRTKENVFKIETLKKKSIIRKLKLTITTPIVV
jgi:hypothetical protein